MTNSRGIWCPPSFCTYFFMTHDHDAMHLRYPFQISDQFFNTSAGNTDGFRRSSFKFISCHPFYLQLIRNKYETDTQPLTAPTTTPFIKYFCTNGKMMIIGKIPMTAMAIRTEVPGRSTIAAPAISPAPPDFKN